MDINVFYGILIPFLGTSAGAACKQKNGLSPETFQIPFRRCPGILDRRYRKKQNYSIQL